MHKICPTCGDDGDKWVGQSGGLIVGEEGKPTVQCQSCGTHATETTWNAPRAYERKIAALEAERADFRDASKVNFENYEFQRRKADAATASVYQFHYAMKDAGWHPGRTDDKLCDIIRAKGAELAKLEAEVLALRKDAERWRTFLATRPANTHSVIIQAIDDAAVRKGGGV